MLKFEYAPVSLGGFLNLTGNRSPGESLAGIKNKPDYERLETLRGRQASWHHVLPGPNPFFPVNTLDRIMRGAIAAHKAGASSSAMSDEIYRHMWSGQKKLDDAAVFRAALTKSDLDGERILALTQTQEVKDELTANTQRSVDRGTFGSPTFFVGEQIFFGKDRLRDVEEAIVAAKA